MRAIGATQVGVLATYPDEAANAFKGFLEAHDIEVAALEILGADSGEDAVEFAVDWLIDKTLAMNLERCEALLVPDTAMPAFDLVSRLEPRSTSRCSRRIRSRSGKASGSPAGRCGSKATVDS